MEFTYLKNFMDDLVSMGIPGNAAIVYKDGMKVFEYASGFSNVEKKVAMDTKTLLNIYSCSKVLTITATLQLYEQGKFLLSNPLHEYILEYITI